MTEVHAPVGVQQNVIGIATKQNTWLHVTPGLGEVPVGQTCPAYTCVHPPVELLQQAVTHGLLGVHVPPGVHVPAQSDWTEMVQLIAPNWQHEPIGGHGPDVGVPRQEVATDWIQPCGHDEVLMKIWHTPVVTLQHTTLGGMHGAAGHGTPMPRNTSGAGHAEALATTVHWPVA